MRPSTRQLEYLVALAGTRHFGRAAKACAVTQPALSLQIRELEELLGVKLFGGGRRQVLVTPAGERSIERAREALRRIDDLLDEARVGSGLALRAFSAPVPSRTIGLVWRRGRARGAEFRALGQIFTRRAPSLERWRGKATSASSRRSR